MNIKYHDSFKPFIELMKATPSFLFLVAVVLVVMPFYFIYLVIDWFIVYPVVIISWIPSLGWSAVILKHYHKIPDVLDRIGSLFPEENKQEHFDSWR